MSQSKLSVCRSLHVKHSPCLSLKEGDEALDCGLHRCFVEATHLFSASPRAPGRDLAGLMGPSSPPRAPTLPLAHVKVLEIGTFIAGPLACTHLAHLGAAVTAVRRCMPRNQTRNAPLLYTFADATCLATSHAMHWMPELRTAQLPPSQTRLRSKLHISQGCGQRWRRASVSSSSTSPTVPRSSS